MHTAVAISRVISIEVNVDWPEWGNGCLLVSEGRVTRLHASWKFLTSVHPIHTHNLFLCLEDRNLIGNEELSDLLVTAVPSAHHPCPSFLLLHHGHVIEPLSMFQAPVFHLVFIMTHDMQCCNYHILIGGKANKDSNYFIGGKWDSQNGTVWH